MDLFDWVSRIGAARVGMADPSAATSAMVVIRNYSTREPEGQFLMKVGDSMA
jgi:hypothetical protein